MAFTHMEGIFIGDIDDDMPINDAANHDGNDIIDREAIKKQKKHRQ